jgi:predicted secreted Zn-dependent protease
MRRLGTTVTVLTLLCASAVAVASAPLIKKTYSYFNISGLTGADLERELSKHGPMLAETGIRHPGATKIKLGGSVDYRNSDGRCRVLDAKVTLETHLTLPRWTDRHRANRETVLVWDTLSSDIKRHEERHAEIARQYARKLEKTLEALYPSATASGWKPRSTRPASGSSRNTPPTSRGSTGSRPQASNAACSGCCASRQPSRTTAADPCPGLAGQARSILSPAARIMALGPPASTPETAGNQPVTAGTHPRINNAASQRLPEGNHQAQQ